MKVKILALSLLILSALLAQGQDSTAVSSNIKADSLPRGQIIYLDLGLGSSFSTIEGIYFFTSLNYQYKNNLFTIRTTSISDHSLDFPGAPLLPLLRIRLVNSLDEKALLYGKRFIKNGHSFSISAGISYNEWMKAFPVNEDELIKKRDYYPGLPFEMNVLWFKSRKKRYRIYGLIPVGKPTSFGNSIGFKLSGNVSRHGFVALGLVFGIGMHKQY